MRSLTLASVAALLVVLATPPGSLAQDDSPTDSEDLAARARDPTAANTAFQITFRWIDSYRGTPGANQAGLVLQPIIPWRLGGQANIARVSASIVTNAPALDMSVPPPPNVAPPNQIPGREVNGLQDTTFLDLLIWQTGWGSVGAGGLVVFPTATDPQLGSQKWQVGPAGVVILRKGKLQIGALGQAFFSVAGDSMRDDIRIINIQPFGGYALPNNWSVGLSEINISYDTRNEEWTSVPFGGRLEKLVVFGSLPARVFGDIEYNFLNRSGTPRWTYRFTVAPLF